MIGPNALKKVDFLPNFTDKRPDSSRNERNSTKDF